MLAYITQMPQDHIIIALLIAGNVYTIAKTMIKIMIWANRRF
jgi:hypothetical protein